MAAFKPDVLEDWECSGGPSIISGSGNGPMIIARPAPRHAIIHLSSPNRIPSRFPLASVPSVPFHCGGLLLWGVDDRLGERERDDASLQDVPFGIHLLVRS